LTIAIRVVDFPRESIDNDDPAMRRGERQTANEKKTTRNVRLIFFFIGIKGYSN